MNSVMIARMLAAGAAGGVLLGGLAGGVPPAGADSGAPSGKYQESDPTGYSTWTFTPCGADCTAASYTAADGTAMNPTFHLSEGKWTGTAPVDVPCPRDGSTVSTVMNYDFDADTLLGDMSSTLIVDGCGRFAGTTTAPVSFKLSKIG